MLGEINKKALQLHMEFEKATERKEYWNHSLKPFLIKLLTDFTRQPHGLGMYVQPNITPDREFVLLIVKGQDPIGKPSQFRGNAVLGYQLTHRGKVLAYYQPPFVKNEEVEDEGELRGKIFNNASYEPTDINKNVLLQHLDEFMDYLLKWETNIGPPLGFSLPVIPDPKVS